MLRTSEEIRSVLETAKLDQKDLIPFCQEIVFDDNFSGTELKLVELQNEVTECIKIGTRLVIRGDANDSAVLCTNSSTFEIKEAETSNSLLILGGISFPEELRSAQPSTSESNIIQEDSGQCEKRQILNIVHSYLELRKVKPNLNRIYTILEPYVYRGPQEEKELNIQFDGIQATLEELLEQIPASQLEIEEYMQKKMKILVLGGKLRIVQSEYLFQVLSHVLDCVESNSWDRTCVSRSDVIKEIDVLHPEFILVKIFEWFFIPRSEEIEDCRIQKDVIRVRHIVESAHDFHLQDPTIIGLEFKYLCSFKNIFAMNEFEICRFLGEFILKSSRKFTLTDFLKAWQQSVPPGLTVGLKQLEGLAVCDTESDPAVIWYFPEESLPDNIQERFSILFEAKPKWTQEEILPYISTLALSSHNAGILLTKYTRMHTTKNRKYYCAKHSK